MRNYLSYSFYRARLGRTYYVNKVNGLDDGAEIRLHEQDCHDSLSSVSSTNRRTTLETRCLRSTLLTVFVIMAAVSGYLFWTVKSSKLQFDFMTAFLIGVFVASTLGAVSIIYRNVCLLGIVGVAMISFGITSIIFIVVATLDYFNDENQFRESTRKIYEGFVEFSEGTRLFYTYLIVMGYFAAHAFAFLAVAIMAWKLRTHYD
uniref:Uncharacterized protein n=1 Tax=Haemonchus contortus TaxID=6289 RepID=A0A7I4XXM6_HAECO